jgi:PAS domain S-box-containing protein
MDQSLDAQLRATLNMVPAHTWYAAPGGTLTFVNERCADYLGLPQDHPLRFGTDMGAAWDSHIQFLHPDDHEATRRAWSDCLTTGSPSEVSFRVRSADGTYRWFLSRAEPRRADDGALLSWIGINLDIEERRRAEQELRDIVDTIPAIVWVARPDGSNTYANSRFVDYSGMVPAETSGAGWRVAVHPDDLQKHEGKWRAAVASGAPHESEVRFRRADGAYRWHMDRGLPLRDDVGHIIKWYGVVTDIEDRKRVEEALRRSEHCLTEAQRLSHTGSFGWNVSTDEHIWSDETFRIFEFDPASAVSLPMILARVHPQDLPSVNIAIAAATQGHGLDLETRLLMPDGRITHLHVIGTATTDDTGRIEIMGAVMDVTERRRAEDAIRRSDAYLAEAQKLSHTGSFGWRPDCGEIVWSDETYRVFEYDSTLKPTVDSVVQRVHPDDRAVAQQVIDHATTTSTNFEHEYRLLLPDGRVKHVHAIAHAMQNASGSREFIGAVTDITERKAAEDKILAQEAELRQMLDFAPQLIAVYGPDRERLYANQVALDYAGVTLDEWRRTQAPGAYTHPDDRERERAYFARARPSGSAGQLELRLRGGEGTYRWFLARYNSVRDNHGRVLRWYVSCTDIDDRKRTEERLEQENVALREEIDKASMFEEIVGASPALQPVLSRISKVAPTDSTVLITGETGTGKELVARAIHRRSRRSARAFISVNCAAIPRDLVASELFGHEKGAFTGAIQRRLGRFELADGGTIFLDEVGELSPDIQVALLRVLQEREFERIGGRDRIRVDVRVIAATNRDLPTAVTAGTFRQDLFYRLNVFPLELPPLRERREDIPILVEYFTARYARKAGKTFRRIARRTLDSLRSYPWPGNIRELQNVIERSVIVSDTDEFTVDESWLSTRPQVDSRFGLSGTVAAHEKAIVEDALRATGGRVFGPAGAAARLGIPRSTLESKIRVLKINKSRFRKKEPSGS